MRPVVIVMFILSALSDAAAQCLHEDAELEAIEMARKWGLVSAGIFVAALAILIPIFNRTRSRYEPGAAPSVFLRVAIRGYSFHGSTAPRRVRLRPLI